MSASYCAKAPGDPWHGPYHDTEYGFPTRDDRVLFERLVLEINQAGLSWLTVLKKRAALKAAFREYDIAAIAAFDDEDTARLLSDAGIIRHQGKISAVIHNAGVALELIERFGCLAGWLDSHHPLTLDGWVRLFRKTFRFTGREIVNEFLMSTGYLPGAHEPSCPIYQTILQLRPPWTVNVGQGE